MSVFIYLNRAANISIFGIGGTGRGVIEISKKFVVHCNIIPYFWRNYSGHSQVHSSYLMVVSNGRHTRLFPLSYQLNNGLFLLVSANPSVSDFRLNYQICYNTHTLQIDVQIIVWSSSCTKLWSHSLNQQTLMRILHTSNDWSMGCLSDQQCLNQHFTPRSS